MDPGELDIRAWIGRTEQRVDRVSPSRARRLAATLDLEPAEQVGRGLSEHNPLPALWHWLAFLPETPSATLGPDGHPVRGGFLPPVPLERRMWAGARFAFHAPLRIGEAIHRRSEILAVAEKTGASGRLVIVTIGHRLSTESGLAVEEEHDVVYVTIPERFTPPAPIVAPFNFDWDEGALVDAVRLFRFSALTFNGHRIHYDLDYCREVERYPGLVVHGPLQALLLLEAARRRKDSAMPRAFRFRSVRPLFHFEALRLVGMREEAGDQALFAVNGDGLVTMQASVGWRG